jgi:tungstate transport system ATP-binding protein
MKSYQGRTILKDCSFFFDRTITYVLMGPNGSGKSTFLRICALLERPDSGEIEYTAAAALLQQDIDLRRRITLVLPRIGVFNTTVFKNVAYGLNIRAVKRKEVEERVGRILAFVGLEKRRGQNALTLSSGETQRLGIARALALEPEVLFLDEPTASVDQENTEIIESIILAMKKEGRTTVIMTTHDREQAERLADRLLVMKHGKIESIPST